MFKAISAVFFVVVALLLSAMDAAAEYGDVVINNYSDEAAVNPVIFPHWFHRIRYTCKTCHTDLNIKLSTGSNKIKMSDIIDGQYCGACHDGDIAWGVENCELCHSAKQGIKTSIQSGQLQHIFQVEKHPDAPKKKR